MARPMRLTTMLLAAVFAAAACTGGGTPAPATPAPGTTISVMSLWGGSEQEAFQKVLDAFEAQTGIKATYEPVRDDYATALTTRISSNNPPDVAIIPGIGFLRRFARDGSLIKIADLGLDPAALEANYAPGILDIGKVDGDLYAIMVKFNSKSTMWYRPDQFTALGVQPAGDWDAFAKLLADIEAKGEAPLGLGAGDSWTLTDWFENIYVRQAGLDKYDQLFSGALPWTDPSVADAVALMVQALNEQSVAGGINAALGRGFVDGIGQAFSANPSAIMYYEGGFVGGIATGQVNTDLVFGDTIDWFDFPSIGGGDAVTIGGDVISAMTENPGVKEFVEFMTTAASGDVWAGTGAIISPVKAVSADVYPNDSAKREAAQVANASAVRFDGSDLLPAGSPDLGAELQKAIRGDTVDWATFEQLVQTAWGNE